MIPQYFDQVKLLLELLPIALEDHRFGLKGGTAINLFFRDMPRLSVDIDLCYLPLEDRETSLYNIELGLSTIASNIQINFPHYIVETKYTKAEQAKNILVRNGKTSVKIEVNLVVRSALFPCEHIELSSTVQKTFNKIFAVNCLSFADTYGGKLCATLDRQHPRDWYDTWILLENEGLTEDIRKAFLLYLLSCKRPISEILEPSAIDQRILFKKELEGMNQVMPSYSILAEVRLRLMSELQRTLTNDERIFLMSFKEGDPVWSKSGIDRLENYPAVRWKLMNINNRLIPRTSATLW